MGKDWMIPLRILISDNPLRLLYCPHLHRV